MITVSENALLFTCVVCTLMGVATGYIVRCQDEVREREEKKRAAGR